MDRHLQMTRGHLSFSGLLVSFLSLEKNVKIVCSQKALRENLTIEDFPLTSWFTAKWQCLGALDMHSNYLFLAV